MTKRIAIAVAAAVLVSVLVPGRASGQSSVPNCVRVATSSRYVPYGYNHVVAVTNACKKLVACSISTDVNPESQSIEVKPGETSEVTTFMGSPSQTFVAKVSCKER